MNDEDQGRWLSYEELGDLLGCTANAARMHAGRRKWLRRSPNRIDGRVRVPQAIDVQRRATLTVEQFDAKFDAQCNAPPNGQDPSHERAAFDAQAMLQTVRETVEVLVTPIREQLDRANETATTLRAELIEARIAEQAASDLAEYGTAQAADLRKRLDDERARADRAEKRADAAQAEQRIARVEEAGLRAELEVLRSRGWWARLVNRA
jgi:hypothetical protein